MNLPANPPESLVLLTRVLSEAHAAILIAALEENQIHAHTSGTVGPGFQAGPIGWVDVLVNAEDLQVAEHTLSKVMEANQEIDWSQIDLGEPES